MPTAGMLYPGSSAEDDYPALERLLGQQVRLPLVYTFVREDAHRVEALREMGSVEVLADGGRRMRDRGVDSVVWACTSGSFVFGLQGAREQVQQLQAVTGVPTSSAALAFVHAAAALEANRVAVAATYPTEVADRFGEFLEASGIEVLRLAGRGVSTAAEVGMLGHDEVLAFAAAQDHRQAQALLLPDTALHTADRVDELETRLGKPVLTANQVSAWQGLRLAGHRRAHDDVGTLFRRGCPGGASAGAAGERETAPD